MKRLTLPLLVLALGSTAAQAHSGHGADSFAAGIAHPLGGIDHAVAMIAVGLWAALKGGRALWIWPAVFVGVMLIGGALGIAHVAIPWVEPGILASVVALGLLVALAVDLPVSAGVFVVAVFALLHGHAHGSEVAETISGARFMAGFALSTAILHLVGIGFAQTTTRARLRPAIRIAGAVCVMVGTVLVIGEV